LERSNKPLQSFTPPWSRIPSLCELTAAAGIDFDEFIQAIENQKSIEEMAQQFQVKTQTIESLQDYFERYGLSSVIGGD
jgi:hypothetical protein